MNPLLPELDWNGAGSGYTESEFPLYPYLVALAYHFSGVNEGVGRALSLLFFLGSAFYLYKLLRLFLPLFPSSVALFFYLTFPMGIFFSAAFMPESCMLFFMAGAAFFFHRLLEEQGWKNRLAFTFFGALMLLVKIPTLYMGIAFFLTLLVREKTFFRKISWWGIASGILLPAVFWYVYAFQLGQKTGMTENIWSIGQDKWGNWTHWSNPIFYRLLSLRIYFQVLTPIGFFLFCIGVLRSWQRKHIFFYGLIFAEVFYFFVVAYGNMVHNYYQIVFALPAAFFIGKGIASLKALFSQRQLVLFCLLLGAVYGLTVQSRVLPFYRQQFHFIEAARYAHRFTAKEDLLLAADYSYPEVLYYADRKGYHLNPAESKPESLFTFKKKGVRAVVFSPTGWVLKQRGWSELIHHLQCPEKNPAFIFCWL